MRKTFKNILASAIEHTLADYIDKRESIRVLNEKQEKWLSKKNF